MKRLAIGLIVAGLVMMAFAFCMDVSVTAPGLAYDDPLLRAGRVANVDLISQRALVSTTGASAFIAGWLALIVHHLKALRPTA